MATGEKMAVLPEARRTAVPRPPIFTRPKRRKGVEKVLMSGVTLRITMTFSGSEGISLETEEAMVVCCVWVVRWFWSRVGEGEVKYQAVFEQMSFGL
jgi:hypothetical protein